MFNTVNFYSSNQQFNLDGVDNFASYKALDHYHENNNIVLLKSVKYLNPSESYKEFIHFMRPNLTKTFELGHTTVEQACSARIGDFTALHCPLNNHEVIVPSYAYIGDYNPLKGDRTVKASASRLVDKLYYLGDMENNRKGGYLIALDLTFPKEISEQLLDKDKRDKALHKAKLCIKDFTAYLKSLYCDSDEDIGLWYNLHANSTREPLKPHLHYHVNILNFTSKKEIVNSIKPVEAYNPLNGKESKKIVVEPEDERFYRAYRYVDDEKTEPVEVLKALKRFNPRMDRKTIQSAWSSIVKKHFRSADRVLDIHLHYISLKNRSAILHRIKYCARKPLMDLFEYYTEHDFDPESINKDYINFLMRYENRRTPIGFVRMLNRIVVAPEVKRVCPVCGNPAKITDHYSFADVSAKLQSGEALFIQWDHKAKEYEIIRSKHRLKEIIQALDKGG